MDLLILNQIELYKEKKALKEALEKELKEMNTEIVTAMNNAGINKVETPNGVTATVTTKVSLKYDEVATIKYLKDNGLTQYIVEKVDTKKLNEELKKSKSLNESIQPSQDVSYALTIK